MNVLTTEAYSGDGKLYILSNPGIYTTLSLIQYKRSKNYSISFNMEVHIDTSKSQLNQVVEECKKWMAENFPGVFSSSFSYSVDSVTSNHKMTVIFYASLQKHNWQSEGVGNLKNSLMLEIISVFKRVGITYFVQPQPVVIMEEDMIDFGKTNKGNEN